MILSVLCRLLGGAVLLTAAASVVALGNAPATVPRFEPSTCPFDDASVDDVRCGYLVVPERHDKPGGPHIKLAVAVLESKANAPAPDPVVYLDGGPGGGGTSSVNWLYHDSLREARDVVTLDQRGTGFSRPLLDCPEVQGAEARVRAGGEDELRKAVRACFKRLRRRDIDVAAYNSVQSAHDLRALAQVLGYERVNLYGISYGAKLALVTAREHPQFVRSVVFDSGTSPAEPHFRHFPEALQSGLQSLFQGCAADRACAEAFPQLERAFYDAVERLNETPLRLPRAETDYHGDDLVYTVFEALYETELIPVLPRLIHQVHQGQVEGLERFRFHLDGGTSSSGAGRLADGLHYTVRCREDRSPNPFEVERVQQAYPRLASALAHVGPEVCSVWDVGRAEPGFQHPVTVATPTLVLAGEYDPITPPASGRRAAQALPNAYFFEFPGLGHGVAGHACADRIRDHFLDAPSQQPEASCIATMPAVRFFTGVIPKARMVAWARLVYGEGNADALGLLIGGLLGVVIAFSTNPLLLRHAVWDAFRLQRALAGVVAAGVTTAYIGFLYQAIQTFAELDTWAVLILGLPASLEPWMLGVRWAAFGTAALACLNVVVLCKRVDSRGWRFGFTGVTLALGAFSAFYAYWDLL